MLYFTRINTFAILFILRKDYYKCQLYVGNSHHIQPQGRSPFPACVRVKYLSYRIFRDFPCPQIALTPSMFQLEKCSF